MSDNVRFKTKQMKLACAVAAVVVVSVVAGVALWPSPVHDVVAGGQIPPSQQPQVVDPADIANLKRVVTPQISPDGALVAYVVETPVQAGKPLDTHLWVTSTAHAGLARALVTGDGIETNPRWSPDGKSIAFLSDRKNPLASPGRGGFQFSLAGADGRTDLVPPADEDANAKSGAGGAQQLWLTSAHGGEPTPLTNIYGGIKSFKWSSDGKLIAFTRTDQESVAERERKKNGNDGVVADHDFKYDRLWIYDIAKHQARLLTKADANIDDFDWSPDGSKIAARISPTPTVVDNLSVSRVEILDAGTGAVERTLTDRAGPVEPLWSPDGKRVAFATLLANGWTAENVIYTLDDGHTARVEDWFPGAVLQIVWLRDGNRFLAQGIENTHTVVSMIDAESGKSQRMDAVATSALDITVGGNGTKFAFRGATAQQPDEVWVSDGVHATVLTDTNPQVKNWILGTQREISWNSSTDGRIIHGVVELPPGYEQGKRYKTVVLVHGGPEEAWFTGWHATWYNYAAMLASHGYAVLLPNPRGSISSGPEFAPADWGGGDFQDVMDGVDSLIAQAIADPDRLVIGGWSFGGFMAAWAATHTARFKAAMAGAAVTDLVSMATTSDIAPNFLDSYFGPLQNNRQAYEQHSAVNYVNQFHTPVLVMHGEADPRVPISQGEEIYNRLRFVGREVTMVRYPREPHMFTEREHQIDSLSRTLDWYDSHLPN